jgi:predicted RNA-binding Zn-ribbon protein involved in translation (DUF1610 family)
MTCPLPSRRKPVKQRELPTIYRCSGCGRDTVREDLTVKRTVFLTFGRNPSTLKSRVTAWLCPDCKMGDADWNAETTKGGKASPPPRKVTT